ncbi:uncharacterized protein LOC131957247 [Physella acuta]|uniref:uncharacterized protein LOC131957247 n=1 Tax=Physella acuta TaxID=109671 RepID=UPI0027DDA654|nr:uncharacterized protein LOC131957247 [Physella acuta]
MQHHVISQRMVKIYINCPLQLKVSDKHKIVSGKLHENLTVNVPVYGYPLPIKFRVSKNGITSIFGRDADFNDSVGLQPFFISYREQLPPNIDIFIAFHNLREEDFTHYSFDIYNGFETSLAFKLIINEVELTTYADVIMFSCIAAGVGLIVAAILLSRALHNKNKKRKKLKVMLTKDNRNKNRSKEDDDNAYIDVIEEVDMRLVSSCEPSEEGTPWTHTSHLDLTTQPDSVFSWSLNQEHVSECSANSNCLNSAFKDWFQSSVQSDGRSVTVNLTIFNTTRWPDVKNADGVWSLGMSQVDIYTADVIFTCHLKVYYKPRDVTCTVEAKKNELHIQCTTVKVYPAAKCFFSMIIDGNPVHQLYTVTYRHTQLPGSPGTPEYFSTQCSITVPVVAEGHYELRVTVYPNVTDRDKDGTYGENTTVILNLVCII